MNRKLIAILAAAGCLLWSAAWAQENEGDAQVAGMAPAAAQADAPSNPDLPTFKGEAAPADAFPPKADFNQKRDARANEAAGPSSAGSPFKWIVGILFLAAMGGAAYYMRKRGFGGGAPVRGKGPYHITQQLVVGPKHRIVVLDGEGRRLIVGVAGESMTLLSGGPHGKQSAAISAKSGDGEPVDMQAISDESAQGAETFEDAQDEAADDDERQDENSVAQQIESRIKGLKRFLAN